MVSRLERAQDLLEILAGQETYAEQPGLELQCQEEVRRRGEGVEVPHELGPVADLDIHEVRELELGGLELGGLRAYQVFLHAGFRNERRSVAGVVPKNESSEVLGDVEHFRLQLQLHIEHENGALQR